MVKFILIVLLSTAIFGDVFQKNCLSCHNHQELKLFMAKYTLKYSSKERVKGKIMKFLLSPTSNRSIMPYSFIIKNGYKNKTLLSPKDLKEAIDIYWNRYNLTRFIK